MPCRRSLGLHPAGPEALGLEEEVRLMPLAEDSEEFRDTMCHFYETLEELHNKISIVKVGAGGTGRGGQHTGPWPGVSPQQSPGRCGAAQQVEKLIHPLLYKQYQLKKASMEKACVGGTVERILFHGTTETSSREICLHGFNRSFCGKNGECRCGSGVLIPPCCPSATG